MILTLNAGQEIEDPTDNAIRDGLASLDVARDKQGFAILQREEMTYLQVSGDQARGFDMELQAGSLKQHYRAEREDFTLDDVVRAFIEYRDGTIDWAKYGDWSQMDL